MKIPTTAQDVDHEARYLGLVQVVANLGRALEDLYAHTNALAARVKDVDIHAKKIAEEVAERVGERVAKEWIRGFQWTQTRPPEESAEDSSGAGAVGLHPEPAESSEPVGEPGPEVEG